MNLAAIPTAAATASPLPVYRSALDEHDMRISPAAQAKFRELMADEADVQAIRIFVSGGGCGGMGYGMTFTDQRLPTDAVLPCDGFAMYVDAVARSFLVGVEIDYVEGRTGGSFVFNNAFALTGGSGTCGACGSAGGGCA